MDPKKVCIFLCLHTIVGFDCFSDNIFLTGKVFRHEDHPIWLTPFKAVLFVACTCLVGAAISRLRVARFVFSEAVRSSGRQRASPK